ncbi:hypothetical protein G6F42_025520 [Rhizopus arrhizus]|nr:hypothetical protein G6F42_025520 [Rhizopus arrhizus]
MQHPYYTSKSQYFSSASRKPRYHGTRDSNSPIGDWLAREEALLDGLEAEPCAIIPPADKADPIQLPYPSVVSSTFASTQGVNNRPQINNSNNGGPRTEGLRPISEIRIHRGCSVSITLRLTFVYNS